MNENNIETSMTMENGQIETYTVQPDPQNVPISHKPIGPKISMFVIPCLLILYIAIIAFMCIMMYRFVRATEKIASKFQSGLVIKKDNVISENNEV